VALLEVVAERRHVGAFTAAKVVGAITCALVVVGEDDELGPVDIDLVFLSRFLVKGLAEAFGDAALIAVELLGQ
jgi:hypothetical protein